jgi:hypothetical protein
LIKQDGGEERRDVRTPVDLQVILKNLKIKLRLASNNV